ncbi:MAG: hypothetical protein ABIK09_12635 [Pseudomonadota bacterium]
MRRWMIPMVAMLFAACGDGGAVEPVEDAAPVDVLDVAAEDAAPDAGPDAAPDTPPDLAPDLPPDTLPDTLPDTHDTLEGCADGEHDGGDGACVPEGECSHGFSDGGDGSCVPEGSCAEGHHDGGDGACVPEGFCVPGFFNRLEGDVLACAPELVLSDPEVGGILPAAVWDGTGATVIWYAPGDAGKWMQVRMTFQGEVLGAPAPLAMGVTDPGVLSAAPVDGGLLAVWEQSGGILRCMRVQQDGSSVTNTLATDVMAGPGEAWVSLVPEAEGALIAWVDEAGAPALARVDDACQLVWGPVAPPLPEGEIVLGAPGIAVKDGVTLVGWPADDGAGEGYHRVLAYDQGGTPGEAQIWQDGPGVVEAGLRLFPRTLGFGFHGLTLGPFGGGVPTPILRSLDKDGVPKASPSAPIPTPPAPVVEPWSVALTDDVFTLAWGDPDTGTLWFAAVADGAVAVDPTPVSSHGPDAPPGVGPGSLAQIPGVGHLLVWSSPLSGQDEIYAAIIDANGKRLH